jgi:hypothetical protein
VEAVPDPAEVPVVSVGWVADPDVEGRLVPAALLDVDERPDVADLPRVHATEGIGDLRCSVSVGDDPSGNGQRLAFIVAVDHPVRCRFALGLGWGSNQEWLRAVSASGCLVLGFGDGTGPWLSLNIDRRRLEEVFARLSEGG